MSDASEHLAPVSYLPWAKPGEVATDRWAKPDEPAAEPWSDEPDDEPDEEIDEPDEEGPVERHDRGERGRAERRDRTRSDDRRAARRRARFTVVDDDPDETGPERDERIDRLVVSRLRRSALSVAEVRAVLAEHGLDDVEIEEWIERYERLGYLDDARLAEQLVHVNGTRRGRGSGAILQELTRRGVDATAARTAVEELDPEVERRNASAVAERRARQLSGLDRQTAERRLSAFLQRRGYPGEMVREVVTAALSAEGS
ncbi:MAG TPA: regulatory protein RecX [Agromyces mariniharenae]|nr:regulatory protein RecX [Agromyces mariniharenae]